MVLHAMAPNNAAVGATRGTSESDELLVGLSKINDATTQAGDSRRGSLRRAMRVATVTSACALVTHVFVRKTHQKCGPLICVRRRHPGFHRAAGTVSRPALWREGEGTSTFSISQD